MAWKKKEKPLTPEEAVEHARKELAPYWFGVEPMFAAVQDPATGRVTAHPLEKTFFASPKLIFFFDPLTHSGAQAMIYAREWRSRFRSLGLEFLLAIRPSFSFVRERSFIHKYLQSEQMEVPAVIDHDGKLFQAFGVDENSLPKVILLNAGKVELTGDGKSCCKGFEEKLHQFLRRSDPGLSLAPVFDPAAAGIHYSVDSGTIDLGARSGTKFPAPGFQVTEKGFRVGAFPAQGEVLPRLKPGEFSLHGTWVQDAERIATSDSNASMVIRLPAGGLSVIAEAPATSLAEEAVVEVIAADRPAWDGIAGKDMILSEEGRSLLKPSKPAVLETLRNLRESDRLIVLRFPTAKRAAVALYSLRFATSS